jgi:hypothetical protein
MVISNIVRKFVRIKSNEKSHKIRYPWMKMQIRIVGISRMELVLVQLVQYKRTLRLTTETMYTYICTKFRAFVGFALLEGFQGASLQVR